MTVNVWTSGADLDTTGIGVIQREVYRVLGTQPGWRVTRGPSRPTSPSRTQVMLYKVRQLAASTRGADVALVMTTPRPLHLSAPYVSVVYDLRWMRAAGRFKALYRRLELRRVTRRAARVLVISQRTRDDLLSLLPGLAGRIEVLPIGPGQCTVADFTVGEPGTVLLIGASPHKRNGTMVEALAQARPSWCQRLICVNVAPSDVARARETFGADRVDVFEHLDPAAMVDQFKRADVYACLSKEEGFGLPFIEALGAGAHVLAVDQPLTRELMGDAAALVADGDAHAIATQLTTLRWPDPTTRRRCAARYSWAATGRAIVQALTDSMR